MARDPHKTQELIKDLLSMERAEELDALAIMAFIPIEPYHYVADIGCGPGYFSIPLAKHLVYGKLYALDMVNEMLDAVRKRVEEANLGNVEILKCGETEFPIPNASLDGVFLAFVLHENQDRVAFLKAAEELLKPRGWCTVLEWYRKDTGGGPSLEIRIEPDELEQLAKESGFRFSWWRNINGKQYMALLRK